MIFLFIIIFVIYFLVDYFILKKSKKFKLNEFEYLRKRYKYSKNFKETKNIKLVSSGLNSLIMTTVSSVLIYCNYPMLISLSIGFVLLIFLIYSVYGIFGNVLKRIDLRGKK